MFATIGTITKFNLEQKKLHREGRLPVSIMCSEKALGSPQFSLSA